MAQVGKYTELKQYIKAKTGAEPLIWQNVDSHTVTIALGGEELMLTEHTAHGGIEAALEAVDGLIDKYNTAHATTYMGTPLTFSGDTYHSKLYYINPNSYQTYPAGSNITWGSTQGVNHMAEKWVPKDMEEFYSGPPPCPKGNKPKVKQKAANPFITAPSVSATWTSIGQDNPKYFVTTPQIKEAYENMLTSEQTKGLMQEQQKAIYQDAVKKTAGLYDANIGYVGTAPNTSSIQQEMAALKAEIAQLKKLTSNPNKMASYWQTQKDAAKLNHNVDKAVTDLLKLLDEK